MTLHQKWDLLYWLAFLSGQLLHALFDADNAFRLGKYKTRRDYFSYNWIRLVVRGGFACLFVFMPYRHWNPSKIFAMFGLTFPFQIPQSAFVSGLFGYLSDSVLNHATMILGRIPGLPDWLCKFIVEQIPPPAALAP